MTEPKLWPAKHFHVQCSGLRLRQLAQVGKRFYLYRIFRRVPEGGRAARWCLERTEVESANSTKAKGDAVPVGDWQRGFGSFGETATAIFDDARKLARFDEGTQLELPPDDMDEDGDVYGVHGDAREDVWSDAGGES